MQSLVDEVDDSPLEAGLEGSEQSSELITPTQPALEAGRWAAAVRLCLRCSPRLQAGGTATSATLCMQPWHARCCLMHRRGGLTVQVHVVLVAKPSAALDRVPVLLVRRRDPPFQDYWALPGVPPWLAVAVAWARCTC